MGIFFTSSRPVVPAINAVLRSALSSNALQLKEADAEAAKQTVELTQATAPQFNPVRFGAAIAIAAVLLGCAIWTGKQHLDDISKILMNCFSGFSGLVLGMLGGEAQKSAN